MRQRIARWRQARTFGVAPGPYDIETRKDLRVPMDDGVELLADLITPIGTVDERLPTIVIRGPYGRRGGVAGFATALAREGFTVLFQSCRGTSGSGGVFTPQLDEERDGVATHRWVRRQSWHSGPVATFGPSYMGYTQWAVAGRDEGPDALCLLVTMPDFGAVTWDNGAFSLRNALGWTQMMDRMIRGDHLRLILGLLRPDRALTGGFGTLPLSAGDTAATGHPVHWYQDWVTHQSLADDYWTRQSHTASVPGVTAPVYMISGWYDIFLPWQLRSYAQLAAAGRPPRLTLGPWGHTSPGLGGPALSETTQFLKEHFAGTPEERTTPVRAYRTGAEQWHDLPAWPPPGTGTQSWHLHRDGRLDQSGPDGGVTSYVYDPDNPTPAVGGPSLQPKSGPADNAAHERRADVTVFRSDPLAAEVTVAGEPVAHIRFRSSQPSADVFVRICDVHPDGRSMTVCDGIRRTESAGEFGDVEVPLWPTFHRFAAGHRISVQVSSGAHPRYARNPGSGEPAATATVTHHADQEISHDPVHSSRVALPVWGG